MDPIEILLRLVGAFYAFAGLVGTRAALTEHFLDHAIAAMTLQRTPAVERHRFFWLLAMASLVLAAGAALMLLLHVSAWLFAAGAAGQGLYLLVLAPRYFDVAEPPPVAGRRQATNAFVLYCAATALVVWAAFTERLVPWQQVPWLLLALFGLAAAAHIVHVALLVGSPRRKPWEGGEAADAPAPPPWTSRRVKVMADYHAHPLWAMDTGLYGDFAPEALGLSEALTRDLNAWASAYTSSLSADDPPDSLWSDAQHRAHAAAARPLAVRLARERPDLVVYVLEQNAGMVQVRADDPV